nr:retrovirus-related Pol polyprotein from transposon TNT 1-94 [Tanacetum cinerariifolium]
IRDIVEEAKVVRPLDSSIVSACRYTKHSQEHLEYVIGTFPQDSHQQDKKLALAHLIRKKQKTNVPVPPSTGVNRCTDASGSQPRSNTKKNRISPAKEAVATACYTQNRSLIHTRHHKNTYVLVHNKKPDLTFFRVFGALCYPTNDSEDLGKLQPTAGTGIFVGYAPSRKGYRIYNKRTQRIMKTIHVQFDELTEPMAPVHLSTGSAPTLLM